jgi:hypothetical protein
MKFRFHAPGQTEVVRYISIIIYLERVQASKINRHY